MLAGNFVMSLLGVARSALFVSVILVSGCGGPTPSVESPDDEPSLRAASGKSAPAPKDEMTASEVVIKLRGNETDIRRCFFANPSARGSLSLSWNVNTEGRVERLKRERSTLTDPRIEQCLGEKLYDVHFDPRATPAHARWTFVFRL